MTHENQIFPLKYQGLTNIDMASPLRPGGETDILGTKKCKQWSYGDHFYENWPGGYEKFSCSAQLSMKFQMLISVKLSRNSAH